MNVKLKYFAIVIFLVGLSVGCGSNCSVTGKVTFPDGSPMEFGEVVFETPTTASRGKIQKDGSYTMYTGELKGVPRGTYQVCISGFKPTIVMAPTDESGRPTGRPQVTGPTIPVAKKFLSTATSDLTCVVKGSMKHNITVEPPQ